MATNFATTFSSGGRTEPRDDVHYRARAIGTDGRPLPLLVVNISPSGLMLRSDLDCQPGDRMSVTLPVIGTVLAEVRWVLGGRIGCHIGRTVPLSQYYELLGAMGR